jgi:hypothetical protein
VDEVKKSGLPAFDNPKGWRTQAGGALPDAPKPKVRDENGKLRKSTKCKVVIRGDLTCERRVPHETHVATLVFEDGRYEIWARKDNEVWKVEKGKVETLPFGNP